MLTLAAKPTQLTILPLCSRSNWEPASFSFDYLLGWDQAETARDVPEHALLRCLSREKPGPESQHQDSQIPARNTIKLEVQLQSRQFRVQYRKPFILSSNKKHGTDNFSSKLQEQSQSLSDVNPTATAGAGHQPCVLLLPAGLPSKQTPLTLPVRKELS